MLKINNLKVSYGGIKALNGISLEIPDGKIVTLIGANGAGKSTTFKAIVGLVKPVSGEIWFKDQNITGLPTNKIIGSGISTVPEGRKVFSDMSVLENLRIGAYLRKDEEGIRRDIDMVFDLFPRLKERHWQQAGTLSGGEQQMLTLCRTLMGDPDLIIIDEPTEGLAPKIVELVGDYLKALRERGISVLLIEQKLTIAMAISDRVLVMGHGHIVFDGTPEALKQDAGIRKEWLEV